MTNQSLFVNMDVRNIQVSTILDGLEGLLLFDSNVIRADLKQVGGYISSTQRGNQYSVDVLLYFWDSGITYAPAPVHTPAPTVTIAPFRPDDPFDIRNLVAAHGVDIAKDMFEREIFRLTNIERANNGLPALIWDDRLARAARGHSRDMSINNFVGHGGSEPGVNSHTRMVAEGLEVGLANENASSWRATPIAVVESWLSSSGHRRNILSSRTHLGVGTYFLVDAQGNITDIRHTQKFADVLN
jgi:uncharacterized protein YkwD